MHFIRENVVEMDLSTDIVSHQIEIPDFRTDTLVFYLPVLIVVKRPNWRKLVKVVRSCL